MVYSDDELLQLFNDGSERGFNGVYEKFWLRVYHYVLRMGIGKDEARDVTTETFIKLFKRKKTFERLNNVHAYLLTTARNATIDLIHLKSKMGQVAENFNAMNSNDDGIAYNEEVTQETLRAVLEEIDNLPNQCRTIFILAFLHGKSNTEISTQLNIVEKTVRNQKHKARHHLRMTIPLRNWLKNWVLTLVA
jgi:RNA polymerase sigma factor (sigma-70 family)